MINYRICEKNIKVQVKKLVNSTLVINDMLYVREYTAQVILILQSHLRMVFLYLKFINVRNNIGNGAEAILVSVRNIVGLGAAFGVVSAIVDTTLIPK